MESDEELPLAAAWEDVKRTRITGLSALEDAQSAVASLGAQVANVDVGGGVGSGVNKNDHRRHPAVLRLLSQCPFPQLAAYVSGSSNNLPSRGRKRTGGDVSCFPPAGGKSARGASAADRRLSDACGVLLRGAEAAERAAKAAGDLFDSIEKDLDDLLSVEKEGIEGLSLKAAAAEEEEGGSSRGDGDVQPSPLSAAVSVSLAAAADALELLAKMRHAVAGGPKREGLEEQEESDDKETQKRKNSPSSVSNPPVSPWSSPEHLHSYAVFWDLAPFAEDVGDIEVALAVERARWKRRRKEEVL